MCLKKIPGRRLVLWTTTAFLAFGAPNNVRSQTSQMLLPSPGAAPFVTYGGGRSVITEPFPVSIGNPRAYVGVVNYDGAPTLLRASNGGAPADVEGVDGELDGGLNWVAQLAYIPGEGLYAVGRFTVRTRNRTDYFWKVRRSNPSDPARLGNPGTWIDEDIFFFNSKSAGTMANGLAFDSQRRMIFVSGWASDGQGSRWVVRGKAVGRAPQTWNTVLDVAAPITGKIEPPICFYPGNASYPSALLTAGQVQSGKLDPKWAIRRSRDGGVNWPDLYVWSPSGVKQAYPVDIACDPVTGNIYALGGVWNTGAAVPSAGWIVQVNRFGGDPQKWETLIEDHATGGSATRIAFDPAGNLSIAGWIDPTGSFKMVTLVRNTPLQSWSESWERRIFPFADANGTVHTSSSSSRGAAITSDPSGTLYIAGEVADWIDGAYTYPGNRIALMRMTFP